MLIQTKRNKIAPISIFFLFYISRIVVSLTNVQSVSTGIIRTDMLISVLLSLAATLLISLPALWCYKNNKNPFDVKGVNLFYYSYFVFMAGVNISRFSSFASSVINPDATSWLFSVAISICVCYAATLGIEGLSRFSAFSFILIVIAIASVLIFNIDNYNDINLHPIIGDESSAILKNSVYLTSSSIELLLLLCLSKKVNGDATRAYVFSVIASFLTIFLLILFVNAVMGDAASTRAYPVYILFQLAKVGVFERIDILHISFWIIGIFVKAVLLVYCASISIKKGKNITKCIISSVITLGVALAFDNMTGQTSIDHNIFFILYFVSYFVIPLLTLIFKKRNLGDELIEKF